MGLLFHCRLQAHQRGGGIFWGSALDLGQDGDSLAASVSPPQSHHVGLGGGVCGTPKSPRLHTASPTCNIPDTGSGHMGAELIFGSHI